MTTQFKPSVLALLLITMLAAAACRQERASTPATQPTAPRTPSLTTLRGTSSYTPYDVLAMRWARQHGGHDMLWVNSGADAGRALVSSADPSKRPDWAFASQGVVAALAARGEDVVIIGTVYNADDALRPIFRKPRRPLAGAKSLFIPRSSIEIAYQALLKREGVAPSAVRVPKVEKADFATITSLLSKPANDPNALDFAILVEPFVTNLTKEHPDTYEVGQGGLYNLHYSVIARREDVARRRADYVALLRDFARADAELSALPENQYFEEMWGRTKSNAPERLPRLMTYRREAAGLRLDAQTVRGDIERELQYLVSTYPADLRMPTNVNALVNETLLREVSADRVR